MVTEMPRWLVRRIRVVANGMVLAFVLLFLLKLTWGDAVESSPLVKAAAMLWILSFVQMTNIVIVHYFESRVAKVVVSPVWFALQAGGLYFVQTEIAKSLSTSVLAGNRLDGVGLYLFIVIGQAAYWIATYYLVRTPTLDVDAKHAMDEA